MYTNIICFCNRFMIGWWSKDTLNLFSIFIFLIKDTYQRYKLIDSFSEKRRIFSWYSLVCYSISAFLVSVFVTKFSKVHRILLTNSGLLIPIWNGFLSLFLKNLEKNINSSWGTVWLNYCYCILDVSSCFDIRAGKSNTNCKFENQLSYCHNLDISLKISVLDRSWQKVFKYQMNDYILLWYARWSQGCPVLHTHHRNITPLWELIMYAIIWSLIDFQSFPC